jgi:hypothetical protein
MAVSFTEYRPSSSGSYLTYFEAIRRESQFAVPKRPVFCQQKKHIQHEKMLDTLAVPLLLHL